MKLKKIKITSRKLRYRLTTSIFLGVLFLITFGAIFWHIQKGPELDGTPKLLRYSFLWNEKVWMMLKSSKRMSVDKPVPKKGEKFRVNGSLGLREAFYPENYFVKVNNGREPAELSISAFKLLPKTNYSTDFRCIEGWSEELHYAGVRFRDFMEYYNVGKKPDGKYYAYVGLETPDRRYYVSLDMESMLHDQTLLAWEINGEELTTEHGAPLRLVIPIKYGIKSLKRIGKIFFSDVQPPDYWAERGYDWYSGF
ncbi:MAG: molybdopterin-dependent oxidoreductase [Bacteriovoracaceae bacterium]|nr:molybdopterin-dependent oxidoreductase [Bacteriovoracaceae bacterium]